MTVLTLPLTEVRCPYCLKRVAGLLAGCTDPTCRARELDDDARLARLEDQ